MDLYFQGRACLNKRLILDNVAQARRFFRSRDRGRSRQCRGARWIGGGGPGRSRKCLCGNPIAAFATAEAKLTNALSSVPDDARGQMMLGLVYIYTKRAAEGIVKGEQTGVGAASGSSPPPVPLLLDLARRLSVAPKETQARIAEALRLSPRDTLAYSGWPTQALRRGLNSAVTSRLSCGVDRQSRPIGIFRWHNFCLAAALAQVGRRDEARSAVKVGLALDPKFTVSPHPRRRGRRCATTRPYLAVVRASFTKALRKVGMPEESKLVRRQPAGEQVRRSSRAD